MAERTPQSLLIVDDSTTIRTMFRSMLKSEGFDIAEAVDGYSALKMLRGPAPAMIFVDVMMPRIDGYKLCLLVKSNPGFAHIPVIMLTSKDGVIDQARAKNAQADGYITKPFTREALIETVRMYFPVAESTPVAA